MINFEAMVEAGVIDASDLQLFGFADTPQAAWSALFAHGLGGAHPAGTPAKKPEGKVDL